MGEDEEAHAPNLLLEILPPTIWGPVNGSEVEFGRRSADL
jgi:hypothetical protein